LPMGRRGSRGNREIAFDNRRSLQRQSRFARASGQDCASVTRKRRRKPYCELSDALFPAWQVRQSRRLFLLCGTLFVCTPPDRNPGVVVFVVRASGEDDAQLLAAFMAMQWVTAAFGRAFMQGTKMVFSDDEHVTIERRDRTGRLGTSRCWVPGIGPALQWSDD